MKIFIIVFVCSLVASCVAMDAGQKKEIEKLRASVERLMTDLESSKEIINSLTSRILEAKDRISSGDIDIESGKGIIEGIREDLVKAYEVKARVSGELKEAMSAYKGLSDSGVPWYQMLWNVLGPIAVATLAKSRLNSGGALVAALQGLSSHKSALGIARDNLVIANDNTSKSDSGLILMSMLLEKHTSVDSVKAELNRLKHAAVEDIFHTKVKGK